jgi:two-component system, chemotaxis family, chemotaxis protein CheY
MRALVLDDSRAMRMILGRILREVGFEVTEAADGREGLDMLTHMPVPDLALIDWNMPVMDGLTFVKEVRAIEAYSSMTLMMVTTESERTQIVRALAAGAHEYLIKPFTEDALVSKLEMLGLLPVVV